MRILLVDTTIGDGLIGGAQTFLIELMRGLVRDGHEVHLLTNGTPNERVRENIYSSEAVVHPNIWKRTQPMQDVAPAVAKWVNNRRPDVFVISVSPDIGWVVLPLLEPNIATLTIGHNDQETFYAPIRHYGRFLTRAVGVSGEICRKYREILQSPPPTTLSPDKQHRDPPLLRRRGAQNIPPFKGGELVEWIPYGVEVLEEEPEGQMDGPLRLLYVGRLDEPQKRISDIVRVAKRLHESGVKFMLDIVGDGEERSLIERELAEDIADGRVRLHGWVDSERVIRTMRLAEVFVLTSEYEGFCISLIEAMANCCTPVVTDIESGNKQLVEDGVNGFVVPVGDVDGFVDKIKFLAEDRERLLAMRRAAWYTGRQYGIERMVENYISCFERAAADARSSPRTPDPDFPLMESCRSKYPLWLRRIKAKAIGILATN